MSWEVQRGDCLDVLADLEPDSIDAIVTDPPYGLGFMGKAWDALPPGREWAELCLRVLKPGGHLVAFGGSRTYHRLAVAVEDAGFEIRDQIMWIYGSGFPKSLDVSKAIDKAEGAAGTYGEPKSAAHAGWVDRGAMRGEEGHDGYQRPWMKDAEAVDRAARKYEPGSPKAEAWQGWGTALKPAHEPIVLARKPIVGTVAGNVLEHGTGGLNVDGCRIGTDDGTRKAEPEPGRESVSAYGVGINGGGCEPLDAGRWPANLILDPEAGAILDEQSGESKTKRIESDCQMAPGKGWSTALETRGPRGHSDEGGASRFFYTAKASSAERNAGLENTEGKRIGAKGNGMARTCLSCGASVLDGCDCPDRTFENPVRKNHHPTVKPIDVMRWLVRLVTPAGGTVLDPFTGSGTTGIAAALEGFNFVGVEREPEYRQIAVARMEWWGQHRGDTADILFRAGLADKAKKRHDEAGQLGLLEDAA